MDVKWNIEAESKIQISTQKDFVQVKDGRVREEFSSNRGESRQVFGSANQPASQRYRSPTGGTRRTAGGGGWMAGVG